MISPSRAYLHTLVRLRAIELFNYFYFFIYYAAGNASFYQSPVNAAGLPVKFLVPGRHHAYNFSSENTDMMRYSHFWFEWVISIFDGYWGFRAYLSLANLYRRSKSIFASFSVEPLAFSWFLHGIADQCTGRRARHTRAGEEYIMTYLSQCHVPTRPPHIIIDFCAPPAYKLTK